MIYILDTDLFTLSLLSDSHEYRSMHARLVTSIITYEEQTRGWLAFAARSRSVKHQVIAYERLKRHLKNYVQWEVVDFDSHAGEVFEALRGSRIRIGTCDLKIASIALSLKATVVTRNRKDFGQVPELRIEDWSQ